MNVNIQTIEFGFFDIITNIDFTLLYTLSYVALGIALIGLIAAFFTSGESLGMTFLLVIGVLYFEYGHTKKRLEKNESIRVSELRTQINEKEREKREFITGCEYHKAKERALLFLKNRDYYLVEGGDSFSKTDQGRCSATFQFTVKKLNHYYDFDTGGKITDSSSDKMYKLYLTVEKYGNNYEYTDAKLFEDLNVSVGSQYRNIL